jgi:hypothetical protein
MARLGVTRNWESASIGIDASASLSGSLIHAGRPILGMAMPQNWTAASILFEVMACPGGTWHRLRSDDANAYVQMQASGSCAYAACSVLDKVGPFWAFRLVSGSIKTNAFEGIQQASARTFAVFFEG